jgi:serine/threonine protein kinase
VCKFLIEPILDMSTKSRDSSLGSEPASSDSVVERSPRGRFSRFNRLLAGKEGKKVFLGFDNDTGREVAWSVFGLENHSNEKFVQTVETLRRLEHGNVVKLMNAWVEESSVVVITERVGGWTLRQYISRLTAPLKLKVVKNWCMQILQGLVYLHEQGLTHGNLNCGTCFVNGTDGRVLVGDFALSSSYESNKSIDIEYFGLLVLELLTKRVSFPQEAQFIRDEELRYLVYRCLSRDITSRELLHHGYWLKPSGGGSPRALIDVDELTSIYTDTPHRLSLESVPEQVVLLQQAEQAKIQYEKETSVSLLCERVAKHLGITYMEMRNFLKL